MRALTEDDPRRVADFRLLFRLGEGGMGRVYLGRSPGGRLVALKTVHPGLAGAPGFRERFAREVRACRAVSGAGTVPVVAADADAPVPWLATAYVPGPSLADAVHDHGPLPEPALWRLLADLAAALAAVHASGLIHRDLKPSNVLLSQDGPRLIDFGIARAADETALTSTGMVVGSAGYMSPEQAEGRTLTPASDVFSLGGVVVHAATGRSPFGTGSGPELLYRVVHHDPRLDGLPAALTPVVRRCLAKDPEERPSLAKLRQAAAEHDTGGPDWLPGPVASAIARRAEHLLNLDADPEPGTDTDTGRDAGAAPGTPGGRQRTDLAPTRQAPTPPPPAHAPATLPPTATPPHAVTPPYHPAYAPQSPYPRAGYQVFDPRRRVWVAPWVRGRLLGHPLLSLVGLVPMGLALLLGQAAVRYREAHPRNPLPGGAEGRFAEWADGNVSARLMTLLLVGALVWLVARRAVLDRTTVLDVRVWAGVNAGYWLFWVWAVWTNVAWIAGTFYGTEQLRDAGQYPPEFQWFFVALVALWFSAVASPFVALFALVRLVRAVRGDVARPVAPAVA